MARTTNKSNNPGNRLTRARRASGMSRESVAAALNTSPEIIKKLEDWQLEDIENAPRLLRGFALLTGLNPADISEFLVHKPQALNHGSVKRPFVLTRATIWFLGIAIVAVTAGFLLWKAYLAAAVPELVVEQPTQGFITTEPQVTVSGRSSEQTQVYVDSSHTPLGPDGRFSTEVVLSSGQNRILVTAVNSFGRQAEIELTVFYDSLD